jgi:hypothetical protein
MFGSSGDIYPTVTGSINSFSKAEIPDFFGLWFRFRRKCASPKEVFLQEKMARSIIGNGNTRNG